MCLFEVGSGNAEDETFLSNFQETLNLDVSDRMEEKSCKTVISRKNFPFIDLKRFELMKQKGRSLADFQMENELGEDDFNTTVGRLTLEPNKALELQKSEEDLRILLVGKTGSGKSATANSLYSEEKPSGPSKPKFEESFTPQSVTSGLHCESTEIKGTNVHIMDTPGFFDTTRSNEDIVEIISNIVTTWSTGFHAWLYVVNFSNPRFTIQEDAVLKLVADKFGKDFEKHCILVFTHGDDLIKQGDSVTLEDFCRRAGKLKKPMGAFIERLQSRVIAIDNSSHLLPMRVRNRESIIALVQQVSWNGNIRFTNELFERAEQIKNRVPENVLTEAIRKHLYESLKLNSILIYKLTEKGISKDLLASVQKAVDKRGDFETKEIQERLEAIVTAEAEAFECVFQDISTFWQRQVYNVYKFYKVSREKQCCIS